MKQTLYLISFAFVLLGCKKEPTPVVDYAIITGLVKNVKSSSPKLSVTSGKRSDAQELSIDENGKIMDTIKSNFGNLTYSNGIDEYTVLNVKKGDSIHISYDANDFSNSLTFSGKNYEISQYLFEKRKKRDTYHFQEPRPYSYGETEFKKKRNKLKSDLETLIADATNIPEAYKQKEIKNLHYEYLLDLIHYESMHIYATKKEGFKVSDDFLNEMDNFSYTNGKDFLFSSTFFHKGYWKLLQEYYQKKAALQASTDSISFDLALVKILSTNTNDTIRNGLLMDRGRAVTYVKELHEYYDLFMSTSTNEKDKEKVTKLYNRVKKFSRGEPSPEFHNYENYAGGTTSLSDFKGKYVYIDVWATWCGPCMYEFPFLKKIEEKYHGKNIEFVGISIDKAKDREKWKKTIEDKELGGVQLLADKANYDSDFMKSYVVQAVPKFILIDPEGKIVQNNAPRPSETEALSKLLDEVL
ncbi:TlpA family protein disulfide reductase [Flavivirga eckloniae]|uniref:Thioredoxin domain-containing protein n=1 Tax=Flavivirga eckloniae TaxID=1803846 RepID=A0A2K9PUE9_9FLAO|nr:TlpA disulfide reductase family protein [Flavivirga eckloniae]AUP80683.1 hypothetical protein C1H87_18975 [Flavivirga eckloniae]